jgi:hypothetical protein
MDEPYHVKEELFHWEVRDFSDHVVCVCFSRHNADIICRLLINNT